MRGELSIVCRPISNYPQKETPADERRRALFSRRRASLSGGGFTRPVSFDDARTLIERELASLGATELVLELDLEERDLRLDGWPRATARVAPRIVFSFDSKYGPLRYACDTFDRWSDNAYAVAKALEALRLVDRYGVTSKGEQYTGWKAIPAKTGEILTREDAARVIVAEAGADESDRTRYEHELLDGRCPSLIRDAIRSTHPDRGGSIDAFQRVQDARRVLS